MSASSYREHCLREKGEQCKKCGASDGIEVHHIDGDRTNADLDNLIPLCRHCHRKLHRSGLDGLEDELLPVEERPQVDQSVTTFQISTYRGKWGEWKDTVPRSMSLEQRIIQLIEADTEGLVDYPQEADDEME